MIAEQKTGSAASVWARFTAWAASLFDYD